MTPVLDCDAAIPRLWDYLDGELTEDWQRAIEAHLELCERCFPAVQFQKAFLRALASAGAGPVTTDRLRERVREALLREGLPRAQA